MKLKIIPITTWNPTKIFAHRQCPLRSQLRYAQHLCPLCFQGRVPFDGACTKCGKVPVKPPALARGIEVDKAVTDMIRNKTLDVAASPQVPMHSGARKIVERLSKTKNGVHVKYQISLDSDWKLLPKYTKGPWFWGELDVLQLGKRTAEVIDLKTGGLIKNGVDKGKVRENDEYQEQLEIYCIAVLCAFPNISAVDAELLFLDARPPVSPEVRLKSGLIKRKDLEKLKRKWEGNVRPMFLDTVFAPRPGWYCEWCDYSQRRGGPCEF